MAHGPSSAASGSSTAEGTLALPRPHPYMYCTGPCQGGEKLGVELYSVSLSLDF